MTAASPRPEEGRLVRRMLTSDLPRVLRIAAQSLPNPWGEEVWRGELESPFGLYLVLEEAGVLAGFIGVKHVAGEVDVMTVAVAPEKRGRGCARALVRAVLEAPESCGARRVHLEVRPSNKAARALYASLGFTQTGLRKGYYGDEDAVLMTLELAKDPR